MNSFITDRNFYQNAMNLDLKRHGAMIYENIHMLSSLLGVNEKLHTPKRSVINHPATQLWKGYEMNLLYYIDSLMSAWYAKGYKSKINANNLLYLKAFFKRITNSAPSWVTDDLIECHKSVLYQKDSKFYSQWEEIGNKKLEMRYDWRK